MVIAICAALAIFFDPLARPLAKGARWLWVRRPWVAPSVWRTPAWCAG